MTICIDTAYLKSVLLKEDCEIMKPGKHCRLKVFNTKTHVKGHSNKY